MDSICPLPCWHPLREPCKAAGPLVNPQRVGSWAGLLVAQSPWCVPGPPPSAAGALGGRDPRGTWGEVLNQTAPACGTVIRTVLSSCSASRPVCCRPLSATTHSLHGRSPPAPRPPRPRKHASLLASAAPPPRSVPPAPSQENHQLFKLCPPNMGPAPQRGPGSARGPPSHSLHSHISPSWGSLLCPWAWWDSSHTHPPGSGLGHCAEGPSQIWTT